MGADVRLGLVVTLLLTLAAARVHTVLLAPSTPSPSWLAAGSGDVVNFTLHAGRPFARVVQSSRAAPCTPLVPDGFARALDAGRPFFLWHAAEGAHRLEPDVPAEEEEEVWFYVDGECHEEQRGKEGAQRLARRKDLDWAQLWGIVLGIAFGLVALAAMACCSWCCCFQHRVRAHQARLHVRDEGVQTANNELPLYERRVRAGEVQLEEAPAPDYHLATRSAAGEADVSRAPGAELAAPREPVDVAHASREVPAAPTELPLPLPLRDAPILPLSTDARHPPVSTSPRDPPTSMMPTPQPYASSPPPPDDLPPAYSHAPP